MSKLPIQSLLYLASLGLALGSGWTFYQTMTQEEPRTPQDVFAETDVLVDKGREQTPDDRRDDYSQPTVEWWKNLERVNWIGKVEQVPVEAAPVEAPKTVTPDSIKAAEVVDVVCVVFDPKGESRIVVRYKGPDVEPPAELLRKPDAGWAGPGDGARRSTARPRPGGNPPRGNQARPPAAARGARAGMPTFGGGADETPEHHLGIGDTLWPRYDDFYLARVGDDAQTVYFRRKSKEGKGEEVDVEEEVFKNELALDSDVLAQVRDEGFRVPTDPRRRPKTAKKTGGPAGKWKDVAETRAVAPGQWHISREDDSYLRDNAQTIFNEDVVIRSYSSSGSSKIRGVQVTRVSPQMQRFGVQAGDVILEINGVPVKSKAQALKVGKEQYGRGVRSFRAKIMTKYGRVEERTYYAPEK